MKSSWIAVLLLNFVNTLNYSLLIPILPFIIKDYGGGIVLYGIILSVYPFFQFFAAPILGRLSDRYGRRPILLISQAGTVLSWIIFMSAYCIPDLKIGVISVPILIVVFARMVDGITGGNNSVASAYLADITTREEKTKAFGFIGGVVGLGLIVGPIIGGLTANSNIGYLVPVFLTFSISLITLIVMVRYLPESLSKDKRIAHIKFDIIEELQFLPKLKKYISIRKIKYLFFLRASFLFVFSSFSSIFILYLIDVFEFKPSHIGLFFTFIGVFLIFNQAFLANFLSKKYGDLKIFALGIVFLIISQSFYVIIDNLWLFIPLAYINNLGISVSMPTFKSLLSKSVDASKQGEIMGIDESFFSASAALSPFITTWVYAIIGKYVFAVLALMLLISLSFYYLKKGWE